jgi:serine/threonine protein kinase
MNISIGTRLNRYEIHSKIGAGGMGEVYLAEDTSLHRKVALKILPEELASNKDRMRRFVQEAQAAAALNHPNIATIHEIGEHEGSHFIAMEFIDGVTLARCCENGQWFDRPLFSIRYDLACDPLRSDPRFQALTQNLAWSVLRLCRPPCGTPLNKRSWFAAQI